VASGLPDRFKRLDAFAWSLSASDAHGSMTLSSILGSSIDRSSLMARFAIVATFDIAEGRMDEFLPLLLAHRERCLKDEPGTLRFDVLRPKEAENKLMLYEEYRDEAAFQDHWNGASIARLRSESTDMIAKLDGVPCTVMS
jgi:quinol monooxygenase YgiN